MAPGRRRLSVWVWVALTVPAVCFVCCIGGSLLLPWLADEVISGEFAAAQADMAELLDAAREFRERTGDWPAELDELARPLDGGAALVEEELTLDPWGHAFVYELDESGGDPRVVCLGMDGVPGGELFNADFGPRGAGE